MLNFTKKYFKLLSAKRVRKLGVLEVFFSPKDTSVVRHFVIGCVKEVVTSISMNVFMCVPGDIV